MNVNDSSSRSFGRTAVAALIMLVAAWLLLHFIIGIASFVLSTLVFVVAVVAVVWALRVLL
jgi:membrane protein required for beta-lactamase induction